jgi:hypothetical protein
VRALVGCGTNHSCGGTLLFPRYQNSAASSQPHADQPLCSPSILSCEGTNPTREKLYKEIASLAPGTSFFITQHHLITTVFNLQSSINFYTLHFTLSLQILPTTSKQQKWFHSPPRLLLSSLPSQWFSQLLQMVASISLPPSIF